MIWPIILFEESLARKVAKLDISSTNVYRFVKWLGIKALSLTSFPLTPSCILVTKVSQVNKYQLACL